MKFLKRSLSIVLSFVLLFTLVFTSMPEKADAATYYVHVTFAEPKAGETPSGPEYDVNVPAELAPRQGSERVIWKESTDDGVSWREMDSTDTFKVGNLYSLELYKLYDIVSGDPSYTDSYEYTVNGKKPKDGSLFSLMGIFSARSNHVFLLTEKGAEPYGIKRVDISFATPTVGAHPEDPAVTFSPNANLSQFADWFWQDDRTSFEGDFTFEDGKVYYFSMDLSLDSDSLPYSDDVEVYINNQKAEYLRKDYADSIYVSHPFPVGDIKIVTASDAVVSVPEIGKTASVTSITVTPGAELNENDTYAVWYAENPNNSSDYFYVHPGEEFKPGYNYVVSVNVKLTRADGYMFLGTPKTTINGTEVEPDYVSNDMLTYYMQYSLPVPTPISNVELAVTAPEVGAAPAGATISVDNGTRNDDCASLTTMWYDVTMAGMRDDGIILLEEGDKFMPGRDYMAVVGMSFKNEYVVGADTKVSANGESDSNLKQMYNEDDDAYYYGMRFETLPYPVVDNVAITVTVPEAGKLPDMNPTVAEGKYKGQNDFILWLKGEALDTQEEDLVALAEGETFAAGWCYTLLDVVEFTDAVVDESTTGTVNGSASLDTLGPLYDPQDRTLAGLVYTWFVKPEFDEVDVEYTLGSGDEVVFKANGDFALFTGVKVDGTLIDADLYSAVSGSTIVTFDNDYMESLSAGEHNVQFVYQGGETDNVTLRISDGTEPNPGTPATGDDSNIMAYVALMILSLLGVFIALRKRA